MAHFCEIDENNIVLRVVVVDDAHESDGVNWCADFFGGGTWAQTSYNTMAGKHGHGKQQLRKNFAGKSHAYDASLDAFIPPKPFNSWLLDENKAQWKAPKPPPDNGKPHIWNENIPDWVEQQT